ncbi:uncharacterized protein EV422DRAFT_565113 [Fimicolochytrium jonesii]|uniref:uncharacterized protein n=1 Tax=Fimicolochytrium jonesii TaxID=1396493 RepID=UPI0022FE5284|nr:uncharacterized protein EV422DRAFT_565113 [Fimicolochytrium jonesii]KAI8824421.1 hypothetical protein EV422DRAFT_565113 [Fimicolochytrium jonesii]
MAERTPAATTVQEPVERRDTPGSTAPDAVTLNASNTDSISAPNRDGNGTATEPTPVGGTTTTTLQSQTPITVAVFGRSRACAVINININQTGTALRRLIAAEFFKGSPLEFNPHDLTLFDIIRENVSFNDPRLWDSATHGGDDLGDDGERDEQLVSLLFPSALEISPLEYLYTSLPKLGGLDVNGMVRVLAVINLVPRRGTYAGASNSSSAAEFVDSAMGSDTPPEYTSLPRTRPVQRRRRSVPDMSDAKALQDYLQAAGMSSTAGSSNLAAEKRLWRQENLPMMGLGSMADRDIEAAPGSSPESRFDDGQSSSGGAAIVSLARSPPSTELLITQKSQTPVKKSLRRRLSGRKIRVIGIIGCILLILAVVAVIYAFQARKRSSYSDPSGTISSFASRNNQVYSSSRLSPDGRWLLAGSANTPTWDLYDTNSNTYARSYDGYTAAISPTDNDIMLTASNNPAGPNIARLWTLTDGRALFSEPLAHPVQKTLFTSDGQYALFLGGDATTYTNLTIYQIVGKPPVLQLVDFGNTYTGVPLKDFTWDLTRPNDPVWTVSLSATSNEVRVFYLSGTVVRWSLVPNPQSLGALVGVSYPFEQNDTTTVHMMEDRYDSPSIPWFRSSTRSIHKWDPAATSPTATRVISNIADANITSTSFQSFDVDTDEKYFYLAFANNGTGGVKVFDLASGNATPVRTIDPGCAPRHVKVARDGKAIFCACLEGTSRVEGRVVGVGGGNVKVGGVHKVLL